MNIINPATEEIIAKLNVDTPDSIAEKTEHLKHGQKEWVKVSLTERITCISNFRQLVLDHKEELAEILTSETGKPIQQSLNEINGAQNRVDHIEQCAQQWLADEALVTEGDTLESISYEPLGVIANISAWNFPYNVGYNIFLYALVAGNAVLYKPSEYASLTGLQFQKYLHQAGIPQNVFQTVTGGKDAGQAVLELPLDGYFFTGSLVTGKHIATSVAHKMVPLQLELGGKDPLYIMDDVADVKQAAINAAEGAFYNNGQSCCAIERIYVQAKIYDEFIEHFVREVHGYVIGNPESRDTFIGPLTRKPQIETLLDQISDALQKGGEVLLGGHTIEGKGYYFEPTVVTNVDHRMKIMKDESFGPIIGIQKVNTDEEATELMLDTEFGLTSAVFSSDESRATKVLDLMNTGTVYWNCCDRVSPNIPWSGRNNSGLGATLSSQGIRAFVQPKAYQMRK